MANFFNPNAKKGAKNSANKAAINQVVDLKIEKLDHNGVGVAYQGKRPVFVAGTIANELVKAKVFEQKSKFAKAKLLEIKAASDRRQEPKCRHFLQCGGCDLQHIAANEQLAFKQKKVTELFGRNDISAELPWQQAIVGGEYGYRRKARIGVQYDKKGNVTVGFRQANSNTLQSVKSCPVLLDSIADIFVPLKKTITQLQGHKGVGHVEVIAAENIYLVVRQLVKLTSKDQNIWAEFAKQFSCIVLFDDGSNITTLDTLSEQTSSAANSIQLSYQLSDETRIDFSVDNFIQVNEKVNLQMVETAIDWLDLQADDCVLDLFCGLGNFSLPIAKKVKRVVGIEGVDEMVVRASQNAKANQINNTEFYQCNLNANWQESSNANNWVNTSFDKVVLDPARAGAFEAIEQIAQLNAKTVLYISCDPSTLARDAKALTEQGYKMKKIMLMDMFSQTKHIETMVLFSLS